MSDTITTIRARSRRLAKLVHLDGRIDDYDAVRILDLAEHPVVDLAALAILLRRLLPRWDTAVVRGAIADPARTRCVRRLLHPDRATGLQPTLCEVPRRWLALDMEGIARPPEVPAADLFHCYQIAVATLPPEFRERACIVQASGSHGFKADLRLRLWFWCDRALSGAELKQWLRDTPADPSVFGAAQPIYTAAPVFAGGAADPLPERIIVIPGAALVSAPSAAALAPPPRAPNPSPLPAIAHQSGQPADRYTRAALIRATHAILSAEKRHPVIIREAASLAGLVKSGVLAESDLRAVIKAAAAQAGKEDADEIESCISWALTHAVAREVRNGR